MSSRGKMTLMLLLCSHSPIDVPPEPQRNASIATVRGAVRPSSKNDTEVVNPPFIITFLSLNSVESHRKICSWLKPPK